MGMKNEASFKEYQKNYNISGQENGF